MKQTLKARVPITSFPIGARVRLLASRPDDTTVEAEIPTPRPWRLADLVGLPVTVMDVQVGVVVNVETRDTDAIIELQVDLPPA